MRWLIGSSRLSLAVVAVLFGLLAVLATLQYRWIAQLSEAERARLQEDLDRAAEEFCADFDREVMRALTVFGIAHSGSDQALAQRLNDRLAEWSSVATWPEMVRELVIVRSHHREGVTLLCFDGGTKVLGRCDWRDEFLPIRRSLSDPRPGLPAIDGVLPGLVLTIQEPPPPDNGPGLEWQPPRDHLVVRFDLDFIANTVFPQLADDRFERDGSLSYLLKVSSSIPPGDTIFQIGIPASTQSLNPDTTGRLFGIRPSTSHSGSPGGDLRGRRPPPHGRGPSGGRGHPPQSAPPPGMQGRIEEGRWILEVRHPGGSLEHVVAKARRRNMAISAAILVMLGFTAILMVASTRRARRLARQQMDFVAAVSHELRTPLTAIRSAGQNLADGVIDDPERVRNYGSLIEREGRRLTEMIGRVLTFAGIRSGRQIYRMESVDVSEIVRAALENNSWILQENGFHVETEIADTLPRVKGDAAALRQVVVSLIDNALKYAPAGRWLGVRCENDEEAGEVTISISDHGPGIPKNDLPQIFEPFHRGSEAVGSAVSGSGLGLAVVKSVVEAHGGSVNTVSTTARGATFTVRLPYESAGAAERNEQK